MKTILVPTDFSTFGNNGVMLATSLAEKTTAKIILQHNISTLNQTSPDDDNALQRDTLSRISYAEQKFRDLMKDERLRKLNVQEVITEGVTDEEILKEAIKVEADLVVLGSHKNEKNDRVFIGSNIQKVMREVEVVCPVLTVNESITNFDWKNILIPASFDYDFMLPMKRILDVVQDFKPTVHLLFVNTKENFKQEALIEAQMERCIRAFPEVKFKKHVYNNGELEDGILNVAEKINADLIAMFTHNRTKKEKYNIGTSEIVAFRSSIPLLSVLVEEKKVYEIFD